MVYSSDWFDFVCISCGFISVIGSDTVRKFRNTGQNREVVKLGSRLWV